MTNLAAILCPIDFSEASRGALRYAWAITQHFGSPLVILAVDEPVLTETRGLSTEPRDPEATRHELVHFACDVLHGNPLRSGDVEYVVATGKPAKQIVRTAQEEACGLIVMSTHGTTGMWKLFFGSTTERVLRETTVPVLVTPAADAGAATIDEVRRTVIRILVPVDLTDASPRQMHIAGLLAEALTVPLAAVHVVEPVRTPLAERLDLQGIEATRRDRAQEAMRTLLSALPTHVHADATVAEGDPAERIAEIARLQHAGLIVMGLHDSSLSGAGMGSVTYRVVCMAPVLMLALPPASAAACRPDSAQMEPPIPDAEDACGAR